MRRNSNGFRDGLRSDGIVILATATVASTMLGPNVHGAETTSARSALAYAFGAALQPTLVLWYMSVPSDDHLPILFERGA